MSARPDPNLLLDLTAALDRGEMDSATLAQLLETALRAIVPQARFACVYRLGERHAFLHASTTPGDTLALDSSPIFEEAIRQREPVYDSAGRAWIAPLHAGADIFGLLEIGADDAKGGDDRIADQVRLYAYLIAPVLAPAFGDDPLVLVQAQGNAAAAIRGAGEPVDMLAAVHRFSGGHYGRVHLALIDSVDAQVVNVIAEAESSGVRVVKRDARWSDYPLGDQTAATEGLSIQNVAGDRALDEVERARLLNAGIHSLLIVPLAAEGGLIGLLEFTSDEPVIQSAARLLALRGLADQMAAELHSRHFLAAARAEVASAALRTRVLEVMNQLATRMDIDADEPAVLAGNIRAIAEALDVERAAIVMLQPGTGALVAAAYPAVDSATAVPIETLPFISALRQGPVIVEDATPRTDRTQQYVTTLGMRAAVFQPLLVQDDLIGLLALGYQRPRTFAPDLVETTGSMAAQLSIGVQTLRQTARENALQEQRVDEIVTTYQSLNTVDDLLRVTLTELSKTLGARHAAIRLAAGQELESGHA